MSKKLGFVIQCRDNSTRYKNKSVRPFYKKKSILELIIERLKKFEYPTVVATSFKSPKVMSICRKMGIEYLAGDEDDVLGRMYNCAKRFGFEGIFRVCADNPFIDLGLMYPVMFWSEVGEYDYISFDSAMRRHEGFFCEYISMNALETTNYKGILKTDREHVTPYIVRHPDMFREKILPIPEVLNEMEIRLTVDSEQDFETAQEVYLYVGEKHWHKVIDYISRSKLMRGNMLKEIALNPKRVQ